MFSEARSNLRTISPQVYIAHRGNSQILQHNIQCSQPSRAPTGPGGRTTGGPGLGPVVASSSVAYYKLEITEEGRLGKNRKLYEGPKLFIDLSSTIVCQQDP